MQCETQKGWGNLVPQKHSCSVVWAESCLERLKCGHQAPEDVKQFSRMQHLPGTQLYCAHR